MTGDYNDLNKLLRAELTAVHQQFFHILALRCFGEDEIVARITEVDIEDFKNAMQIIDLLVAGGFPPMLGSQQVVPGSDIPAILRAEQRIEMKLAALLPALKVEEPEARARICRASAPRESYRTWLETMLAPLACEPGVVAQTGEEAAELSALLIVLIEQAMVHAFLLWHRGDRQGADDAWKISGAAMLYAAAIVRRTALERWIPVPAPVPQITLSPSGDDAFDRDIALVGKCVIAARSAAERQEDGAMRRLYIRISDDCSRICAMKPGSEFPAELGKSPVFASFAATRNRTLN